MTNFKRCPVCSNMLRSYGKKTCGGTDCIRTWKSWNAASQYKAMLEAENPNQLIPSDDTDNADNADSDFLNNILKPTKGT